MSESQGHPGKHRRPSNAEADISKRRPRRSDASDTAPATQSSSSTLATSQKDWKSLKDRGTAPDGQGSEANATAQDKSKRKRKDADTSAVENVKSRDQEQRTDRHRSQKSTQEDQDMSQAEKRPTYQHLTEVTRRVSRQTIEAKWEALPPSCIERVLNLLEDIQRPVVVRLGDERRRTQASTALQMVSRRLVSKISRGLPFPQSTGARREDDFDFEKILDHSRDLEAQLTTALHANDLLASELRKETAHLKAEEDVLLQLETNAKTEATRRREAGRKLHMLLQAKDLTATGDVLEEETGNATDVYDAPLSLVNHPYTFKMPSKLRPHLG